MASNVVVSLTQFALYEVTNKLEKVLLALATITPKLRAKEIVPLRNGMVKNFRFSSAEEEPEFNKWLNSAITLCSSLIGGYKHEGQDEAWRSGGVADWQTGRLAGVV